MPHDTPLIATIVVGLSLAFALGTLAQRIRVSPIVGYLIAGVVIGPFTPGYVADQGLATELAEIGIILLMFGVGLHFSLSDLLSVRAIAVPGARTILLRADEGELARTLRHELAHLALHEAVAVRGEGVLETLVGLLQNMFVDLARRYDFERRFNIIRRGA